MHFDQLVTQAGYPGSRMVPTPSALLSLLALKLPDKERRSHISDFNFDEALRLFAGLNILPKIPYATDVDKKPGWPRLAEECGFTHVWVGDTQMMAGAGCFRVERSYTRREKHGG